jgi:hypothetical protein
VRAPRPRESAARAVGIPVACYLGVALAIPFCHRMLGHGAPPLAEHAAQTSTAVAFLAAVAVLGRRPLDRLFSRRARLCARS